MCVSTSVFLDSMALHKCCTIILMHVYEQDLQKIVDDNSDLLWPIGIVVQT